MVVISPLVSLIHDQVSKLLSLGIRAEKLCGDCLTVSGQFQGWWTSRPLSTASGQGLPGQPARVVCNLVNEGGNGRALILKEGEEAVGC